MKPFTQTYIRETDYRNNHWEYSVDGVFASFDFDKQLLAACGVPEGAMDALLNLNKTMGIASFHAAAEDGSWRLGRSYEREMREIASDLRKEYGDVIEPVIKSINGGNLVSV